MKLANTLAGATFLLAAALQFNDPDPARWLAIYLAAAGLCLSPWLWKPPWYAFATLSAVAMAWAAGLWAGSGAWPRLRDQFASFQMASPQVETAREVFGLLLVGVWLATNAVLALRSRPRL